MMAGMINPYNEFIPYGAAVDALASEDNEILLSGPAGTGKSRAILEKLNFCMLQYPGARGLIIRKTRESLTESGLVTYEKWVLGENNPICQGPDRNHRQRYTYPNGSEVVVGGLDKPGKIMSTEYDLILVQEAIELSIDALESLTTRLRNGVMPFQQLIADTNPANPHHPLLERVKAGRMRMVRCSHKDNPRLWDALAGQWTREGREYLARLEQLTGARRQRLLLGNWAPTEGVIYDEFDPAVHVCHRDRSEFRRFVMGVDEGYTNPAVALVIGLDSDDRAHVLEEFYKTHVLQVAFVDVCADLVRKYGAEMLHVDSAAAGLIAEMRARGLPAMGANKAVNDGIQAVKARLAVQGDGRPRLTIEPTCVNMVSELESYVWARDTSGNATDKPLKENDHALDAARYACMAIATVGDIIASVSSGRMDW